MIEKVRSTIKNEINWNDVPEGLEHIAVDMAVGEFLLSKKTFAPDDLTGFDLEYAVKQIQTGDTNTVFSTGEGSMTPEQRLTSFINLNMPLWHALLASFLPSAQTMHESLFTGYFLFHFVLKSS